MANENYAPKVRLTVKCDGACEPINPGGTATYGFVVYWDNRKVHADCGVVCRGREATNNVAEYWSVIKALEYLRTAYPNEVVQIMSDSELVIRQVNGIYKIKAEHLKSLNKQIKDLASTFPKVMFKWIPRERNKAADEMSRMAFILEKS